MRSLIVVLAILLSSSMYAQITVEGNTLPKVGDVLQYQDFRGYEDTLAYQADGADVRWDIGRLNVTGTTEELYSDISGTPLADSFPEANMLLELGGFQAAATRSTNSIEIIGISTEGFGGFGIDAAIEFANNYTLRQTPLTYGSAFDDSFEVIFTLPANLIPGLDSLDFGIAGAVLDSIRVTTNISKSEEVVAWGTLSLWGTEKEVLKVKQIDNNETGIEIGLSVFGFPLWIDASAFLGDTGFGGAQSLVTYKFLSADLQTSVLEFTENRFQDTLGINFLTISGRASADIMSGTENLSFDKGSLSLFPNPSQDLITISSDDRELGDFCDVEIIDLHGRSILSIPSYYYDTQIDIGSLSNGPYLLRVTAANNNFVIKISVMK